LKYESIDRIVIEKPGWVNRMHWMVLIRYDLERLTKWKERTKDKIDQIKPKCRNHQRWRNKYNWYGYVKDFIKSSNVGCSRVPRHMNQLYIKRKTEWEGMK